MIIRLLLLLALLLPSAAFGQARIDQLGVGAAISDTDQMPDCQGCGPTVNMVRVPASSLTPYIQPKLDAASHQMTGQITVPAQTLTDSGSIAVSAAGSCVYTLTLTGPNHLIQFPTGLISGQQQTCIFRTIQGSGGPYTPIWGAGYQWVGLAAPSFAADYIGQIDETICDSMGSTTIMQCRPPAMNIGPAFTITSHAVGTEGTSSGAGNASSATINVIAGDQAIVWSFNGCGNSGCNATPPTVTGVTGSNLGTCVQLTGAHGMDPVPTIAVDIWRCPVSTSGTSAPTVTYSATAYFSIVGAFDLNGTSSSPDDGIGKSCNGTSTSPSCTTNGNTSQTNEFVVSLVANVTGVVITAGGTLIDSSNNLVLAQYGRSAASGVAQTATASLATSQPWVEAIAALKHP